MSPNEKLEDKNQIRDSLRKIISQNGISILNDPDRVFNFLCDYSPGKEKKKLNNLIIVLLNEQIPQDLLSNKDTPYEILLNKAIVKILENHAFEKSSVKWAINCWAIALGIVDKSQIVPDPDIESLPHPINPPNDEMVNQLIHTLHHHRDDSKRNRAACDLRKFNNSRVIDALIQAVNTDARVRFEALKSLSELKSKKALQIFIDRLTDPSARIRRISILALEDFGEDSAIEPLQEIVATEDYKHRYDKRHTNWGKAENVKLAEDAIAAIRIPSSNELTNFVKAGMNYNKLKEFENAISEFDKELRNNPNNSLAIREKGFAFSNLGRYDQAMQLLSRALELNPGDSIAWRHKGYIFSKWEKQYEAINCYDASLKINPTDSTTWQTKGYSLHKLKKYNDSLECYRKAIELDDSEFYNWFLASKVLRDMHRYEDEIVCLKKAFQIDNKSYYCLNGMGWAYVNLYQFQQGLQCFEGVLNFDKFNQNALKGRAVCLEKLEPRRPLNPNQNPVNKNKDEGLLKKIFPFFK